MSICMHVYMYIRHITHDTEKMQGTVHRVEVMSIGIRISSNCVELIFVKVHLKKTPRVETFGRKKNRNK